MVEKVWEKIVQIWRYVPYVLNSHNLNCIYLLETLHNPNTELEKKQIFSGNHILK